MLGKDIRYFKGQGPYVPNRCSQGSLSLSLRFYWTVLSLTICGVLFPTAPSEAADRPKDEVELRMDAGFKVELPADLRLRLTQNIRFDDRIHRFYQLAPELELGYQPFTWMYWGVGYRYSYDLDSVSDFQHRHRAYSRLVFPWSLPAVRLIFRTQWQVDLRAARDEVPREVHMLRLRVMLKGTAVPVVNPYLSIESFQRLDSSDAAAPLGGLRKVRLLAGVEWPIGGISLNVGYFIEVPVLDRYSEYKHAIIIGGSYTLVP